MRRTSAQLFYLATALVILTACDNKSAKGTGTQVHAATDSTRSTKTDTKAAATTAPAAKADPKLNDIALYLAGMKPGSFDAIPEKLQTLPFYKLYSDSMDRGFRHIEEIRLGKMRAWAKTELADELAHPKTVFYPFSGPDILHCIQFYPEADQYIMIALERYGTMPDMSKMDAEKTTNTLNSTLKSLEDIFGKSYFITRKMLRDVSNRWNGFTPIASVFLVRSGCSIVDIKYKHLMDDGKTFEEISADSTGHHLNDCVEIYFTRSGSSKVQKLIYFKTNLSDGPYGGMAGFESNKGLRAYFDNMPECYTYVKSASYLMNYPTFDIIRRICLSKSKSILQDDTGIALKYVDKAKWNMKFYGNYVKPVSDFSGVDQPDLYKAYKDSSNVKPLGFSLGYHWAGKNTQNLMKFERK
jgi:hypothetical protein